MSAVPMVFGSTLSLATFVSVIVVSQVFNLFSSDLLLVFMFELYL